MPDPAALHARAVALRSLAADVDNCVDLALQRARSPRWSSPNADDVRAGLRQAQSRAHAAADALRAEATDAARAAEQERERREQARREQERLQNQMR